MSGLDPKAPKYSSMFDAARQIVQKEGYKGLFKGLVSQKSLLFPRPHPW
jgi:hypothetical protein